MSRTETMTARLPEGRPAFGEPVVEAVGLSKVFTDFWMRAKARAVDGIDFEIRRHEIFGLLGPNGSGKSTTIKMILGLLHKSAGRLSVFGREPSDVAVKGRIGYLPEESYLYRFLDARETLDYYGRIFGLDRRTRLRRIDELLEMVGLAKVRRRAVGEFSKGMTRRLGLAQALINDPELLILDEPTSGLDPIGTRQVKDLLLELGRRGTTILLSSHLLADVEDVCDRMVILYGGRIQSEGTTRELLADQDRTVISTSALDESTVREVEEVLRRRGISVDAVERPRQKLEDLFMGIVERAQSESAETSGALQGGRTASFLSADESSAEVGESLIESLQRDEPIAPVTEERRGESGASVDASKADNRVLEDLLSSRNEDSSSTSGGASEGIAAPEPRGHDESLIDDLLGDDDRGRDS